MLTKNIKFNNFKKKKIHTKLKFFFKNLVDNSLKKENLIHSFTNNFHYSFNKNLLTKLKRNKIFQIYGMGGSSLGAQAIYDFLKINIKKRFYFFDNLDEQNQIIKTKKKTLNIIISKSGNTLETIVNENIYSSKNKLYITENRNNYLRKLALKLKSDIIEHKNFIGGRYSVLSEVGMLPAELMGLNTKKFKRFNKLITNKYFVNNLLINVETLYHLIKRKKTNSIILNYDESSNSLFKWYQQLVAESLGKNSKGVLPFISNLPKDNHSLMQLYLDGNKNSFYTIFDIVDHNTPKIKDKNLLEGYNFLKNKNIKSVMIAQKDAVKRVFQKQGLKFRSFEIFNKDEESLGIIFTYFMLETILLGKLMKLNPFDQPAVESIKKETKAALS